MLLMPGQRRCVVCQSQASTPPWREQVPLRCRLKLYVPSPQRAVAPWGALPERERAGACTVSPSLLR
ncbi:hypothetical protein BX592_12790 [Paraburkholderia rhizosphaerae]|uniref:Uncharacterized protein n=1 Tax=Paraburkholderia rhizosphaerae TaxID=480658 RepID=A0A4R8LD76_9BURK|nr:hypothetical protein BX592_12790 [Paraburkholderia rhizosphaerae]